MIQIRNTIKEMKSYLMGLLIHQKLLKKAFLGQKDITIETTKSEKAKKKSTDKKENRVPKKFRTTIKGKICIMEIPEEEKEEGTEEIKESIMTYFI